MKFIDAIKADQNITTTTNGHLAYKNTLNPALDVFSKLTFWRGATNAGRTTPPELVAHFDSVYKVNPELAARLAFYARDVRGGAGERAVGRVLLRRLALLNPKFIISALSQLVEMGRWDDLLHVASVPDVDVRQAVYQHIWFAILKDQNSLAAKWMPRRGQHAEALRLFAGMTKAEYRRILVSTSNVVEQLITAKEWEKINYAHLPANAIRRHHATFMANDRERFEAYQKSLIKEDGTVAAKVNVGGSTPVDIIAGVANRYGPIVEAQWQSLSNPIPEGVNILPMIDTSSSMYVPVDGRPSTTCMDAAIALGMFMSERQTGDFKGTFLTFSSDPRIDTFDVTDNLFNKYRKIQRAEWGGSTNLRGAFTRILDMAVRHNVPQHEMPQFLVVLSDMQIDMATNRSDRADLTQHVEQQFAAAGYIAPRLVFWDLANRSKNTLATGDTAGVALVSGFSPNMMNSVLSGDVDDFNPVSMMLKVLSVERYDVVGELMAQSLAV